MTGKRSQHVLAGVALAMAGLVVWTSDVHAFAARQENLFEPESALDAFVLEGAECAVFYDAIVEHAKQTGWGADNIPSYRWASDESMKHIWLFQSGYDFEMLLEHAWKELREDIQFFGSNGIRVIYNARNTMCWKFATDPDQVWREKHWWNWDEMD